MGEAERVNGERGSTSSPRMSLVKKLSRAQKFVAKRRIEKFKINISKIN